MKLGNGEGRSQNPLWRICRHLGGFTVGGSPKELVELCDEQLVSSGQVVPRMKIMSMMVIGSSGRVEQWDKVSPDSHAKCQVIVVEGALDVGHHIVLVH